MSEPKKKRGRKPKNKIVLNENPIFENNEVDNLLITCIKKPKDIIIINEDDNIKPNDENLDNYTEYETKCIHKCWNCSYDIKGEVYSYPKSYYNNLFHINGNFCSHECASRYIYETYKDTEFQDKYYLLNFYVNIMFNKTDKIKIPLSKLRLKDFGGDLTKEEYLQSKNITYDCYVPPTIYVNNHYYSNDNIKDKSKEFKLFRKNKKKGKFDLVD